MRRFKLFHETIYDFQNEVTLGPHRLLIRPREGHDIRIESSTLNITPNALVKWHRGRVGQFGWHHPIQHTNAATENSQRGRDTALR